MTHTKDEVLKLALEALETELAVDMTNGAAVGEAAELMCEAITAIKQALAAPVLDGWILVPVTLTNDMTSAMADALEDPENERSSWDLAENMWRAMLPKVPTPPAQPAPMQQPVALRDAYIAEMRRDFGGRIVG
jgi:hypothetical protein